MNLALAVLPVAFLVSLLRTRLDRSMVSDLLIELQRPLPQRGLRDALAAALGDDSLELGLWIPDIGRHVSNRGSQLDLVNVENTGNRYATEVRDSDGKPLAVLIHDPALLDDPLRVEAVVGAARLALENERLQAQLLAQLEEVRASRIRIVEAGDQARRRLERDLHDGAQQRLLALSLAVERARSLSANFGSSALADLLADVTDQLKMSLAELRELARGIHPALLTDEGLLPAVDSIARRAQVPTKIVSIPTERYPVAVEAAAYYVIAEALTNAARHSAATEILVQVDRDEEWLQIEVSDDGRGGADPTHGSGLRGLEDRIVSIGGVLRISSPLGEGTCLLARIPITSTVAPE
jgi:signal transduction histidine kinase